MTKAEYRPKNSGHFGLAFSGYTHFTSPIRRYADLEAHRLLRRYLAAAREMGLPEGGVAPDDSAVPGSGGPHDGKSQKSSRPASDPGRRRGQEAKKITLPDTLGEPLLRDLGLRLEAVCERCSAAEKIATSAEREYTKLKSLEYISKRVGNSYEGIISGVTSFGIFVELSRYLIEGLVRVADLPGDFYTYDEHNFRFVGQKTKKIYRLGDRVQVKIQRVSVTDRKADFIFV